MRGIRGESFDGLRIRKTSGGAASQLKWRYAKHPSAIPSSASEPFVT
jgi:hypothetical protein